MGLIDLITISRGEMKGPHDGPVHCVEQGSDFGWTSSFKRIDFYQWHNVISLFCIPSRIPFLGLPYRRAAAAPVRILRAACLQFTGLNFWTLLPHSVSAT